MEIKLKKGKSLSGVIEVPGDKSISHRSILLGSLCNGKTVIENFLDAKDPWATVKCMQSLGVNIEKKDSQLIVHGKGLNGLKEPLDILDVGNSGTTIRLLSGILAAQDFYSVITGDESIKKRPMERITGPLLKMGADIDGRRGGSLAPLTIRGGKLKGTEHKLKVASAQVKSAILLAGLFTEDETIVTEPGSSRDHTERMLKEMGVILQKHKNTVSISGAKELKPLNIKIPGDFSSAAFFIVAASIVKGSKLRISEVGINPTRTGLLKALKEMGADIKFENEKNTGGEPVADIIVTSSDLSSIEIGGEIIPTLIDEIPILAVAAAVSKGKTIIRDAAELKVKESNRISAIAQELSKMGANIRELPDGLEIEGVRKLKSASCKSYNDHRIAMALSVASLVSEGETAIAPWECVDISFPGFLNLLKNC